VYNKFPVYRQLDSKDCGPTCIRIIAKYFGKEFSLNLIQNLSETTREGSSLYGMAKAAEKIGLHSTGAKVDLENLKSLPLPCVIHWNQDHFVVLYKIKKNKYYISDPEKGLLCLSELEFKTAWIGPNSQKKDMGIIMLIQTTPDFYEWDVEDPDKISNKTSFKFLFEYIKKYRSFLIQLLIGLVVESVLLVLFPLLTQSIVDIGIKNKNLSFIYLILAIQLMFMLGKTMGEVIKSWILLHLSTRINISLVSDFFIKLMKLPIGYFDSKLTGDLMQRIKDHDRIESLLTRDSLNIIFAMFNLITFSILLAYYSMGIFALFWVGSILFVSWVFLFIKKRKILDYEMFEIRAKEESKVIELINGMQEIKLHNIEQRMRWSWEYIKARLFKAKVNFLALEQKQSVGGITINEIKNILIIVYTAQLVVNGSLSLGAMLAISYIIGQLNRPIYDIIEFVHSAQDAKLSLERISEIHNRRDEISQSQLYRKKVTPFDGIYIRDLTFRYKGTTEPVLKKITLTIPSGKTTAIVGPSGSGKTTLMKILLKFYTPNSGGVFVGQTNLDHFSHTTWRDYCGAVMQEGHIFSNTISFNIALTEDVDYDRLISAVKAAEIKEFIEAKPLAYNTKIGKEGIGLSTGQKQRILIARAIYKNPEFILFDEATSSLDANNEKKITKNLNDFFSSKTAIIIAHRLSTVKKADNIVVLDKGEIVEMGNHQELVDRKGFYFNLVKNQLELDK